MAATWICGFEAAYITAGSSTANPDGGVAAGTAPTNVTSDTATVRTGSRSLKVAAASGSSSYFDMSGILTDATAAPLSGYCRVYVRVTARPATTARMLVGSATTVNLRLNPAGTIAYYNGATLIGTSTTALTDTTKWYRVEFRTVNGTSITVLQIDGNAEVTGSPATWTAPVTLGANDTVADTYTAYYDDLVTDNAAFPGDGKVALLVPTADSSRSGGTTGWTNGAGTTTSLFDALDNKPPTGATTETATTNIICADGSGVSQYTATMTTYSAAGIGANDTVNAVCLVCTHGEDIATGTKEGTFELTSNPVVAATVIGQTGTIGFGGNGGAHASVTANGTSGGVNAWRTQRVFSSSPSVTIASAPLMKVVKTDTGTRGGCICFLGLYVSYTPAIPKSLVPARSRSSARSTRKVYV